MDELDEDIRVSMSSFREQLKEFCEVGLFNLMEEMRVELATIKRVVANNNLGP